MRKIVLIALAFCMAQTYAFAQSTVEVHGDAEMKVDPIGLMVEVSILNREKSSEKALKSTSKTIEKIVKVINKNEGISHFSTNDVNIEGNWNKTDKGYEYVSTQTLSIRIDSILAYDEIMQKLAGTGVNQISKVSYIVANEGNTKTRVLAMALANARKKADALARGSGQSIDTVVSVKEEMSNDSPSLMEIKPEMEGSFLPSQVTLRCSVTATYSMK